MYAERQLAAIKQEHAEKEHSAKKEWLLEGTEAADRHPSEYEAYDLTNYSQILEAYEAFVQSEPHSAWEMHRCDP